MEDNLPAMWFHPDSSEPVTNDKKNCIKMGDHERSKFRTSRFTNFKTTVGLYENGVVSDAVSDLPIYISHLQHNRR